ncbi:MAG TPA: hypothetical protein VGW75_17895 [Solirubrobacteraceae bacterium]|nr:hypothetical protein [Solirubrobacteraceae bacterium]
MPANGTEIESELTGWTIAWLRERLPSTWVVDLSARIDAAQAAGPDAVIEIRAPNVYATVAVQAKRSLAPRDVDRLLGGVARTLRALTPIPILVVAPWISSRTRELLTAEGLNYLDQTGNASIRLENPALVIETHGSSRDPAPAPRAKARVRGPKAARLIRTLIDVRPPYGVRELADAAGLAPGYVSRLLDALDDDALVTRSRRARVEEVDVRGLLRHWAESYDVFKANAVATFIAPRRPPEALAALAGAGSGRTAVTGSFAAVRFAAVAAPALLAVYCEDAGALAGELDLLPADHGANVALLSPFDAVVWTRTEEQDGVRYVAPSQAAVDCLTGTGRMPAEGEALVEWMLENEQAWRDEALAASRTR